MSTIHFIFYHCGHLRLALTHQHHNDICPDNLPRSKITNDDCHVCEAQKKNLDKILGSIDNGDDFLTTDKDRVEEDANAYDGDDELSSNEDSRPPGWSAQRINSAELHTNYYDAEDNVETWIAHVRSSATGECECIVCEFESADLEHPPRQLRVVS